MSDDPIEMFFDGEKFWPTDQYINRAIDLYPEGEVCRFVRQEEQSSKSRSHYFISLTDSWKNLPHGTSERFQNFEHFRKWCLISCGYCTVEEYAFATADDAARFVLNARRKDSYAVILVVGNTVQRFTAKSQSPRSMGKKEFEQSKQDVLDLAASMVGISTETLQQHAGRSA